MEIQGGAMSPVYDTLWCSVNVGPPWISKSRLDEASKTKPEIELTVDLLGEGHELWVLWNFSGSFFCCLNKDNKDLDS